METLLTEIMISQETAGKIASKAGTQLLSIGYHELRMLPQAGDDRSGLGFSL
jgi:hypothetical protein